MKNHIFHFPSFFHSTCTCKNEYIKKISFIIYFFIYSGINAEITYTIQTDNNKNSSEFFHIDEDEGTIYLKKSLDHETQQHHRFTIKVIDKGSPALSSSK